MKTKITNKGRRVDGLRMGCSGYGSGRCPLSADNDSWTLCTLRVEAGQLIIAPSRLELYPWKVSNAEIDHLIESVLWTSRTCRRDGGVTDTQVTEVSRFDMLGYGVQF